MTTHVANLGDVSLDAHSGQIGVQIGGCRVGGGGVGGQRVGAGHVEGGGRGTVEQQCKRCVVQLKVRLPQLNTVDTKLPSCFTMMTSERRISKCRHLHNENMTVRDDDNVGWLCDE
jgi:myosin-crossreactive antigen